MLSQSETSKWNVSVDVQHAQQWTPAKPAKQAITNQMIPSAYPAIQAAKHVMAKPNQTVQTATLTSSWITAIVSLVTISNVFLVPLPLTALIVSSVFTAKREPVLYVWISVWSALMEILVRNVIVVMCT